MGMCQAQIEPLRESNSYIRSSAPNVRLLLKSILFANEFELWYLILFCFFFFLRRPGTIDLQRCAYIECYTGGERASVERQQTTEFIFHLCSVVLWCANWFHPERCRHTKIEKAEHLCNY